MHARRPGRDFCQCHRARRLPMRVRLEALLRPNRSDGGLLTLYDAVTGLQAMTPIPCLGRASGSPPSTQVNGNTPTGEYVVTGILPAGSSSQDLAIYGIHPRLMLRGVSGEARLREQVSANQLRIHGGHMKHGNLMATLGCIRVSDVDMRSLLTFLQGNAVSFPFILSVRDSATPPAIISGEDRALLGEST